jgi:hypothetical protein
MLTEEAPPTSTRQCSSSTHNPFGTSGARELLRENAVVGVRASFNKSGGMLR